MLRAPGMGYMSGVVCRVALSEMSPDRPALRLLFAVANNVPHIVLITALRTASAVCGCKLLSAKVYAVLSTGARISPPTKNAQSAGMSFMFHHVRRAVCPPDSLAPFNTPPLRNPRIGKSPQKRPTYLRLYCRRKSVQPKQIYCNEILIGPLERGPRGFLLPKRRRHQRGTGTLLLASRGDQAAD